MDRKKELKQLYKDTPIKAGVFQIKNNKNSKVFIGSTMNVKTLNGTKFMLENGEYINNKLQDDWNLFGKDSFTFEVIETLKKKDNQDINMKDALAKLEQKWLERLQPFGEQGYNQ